MAIVQPGIPNGGFTNPTPVTPRARVANPGIPNGGFTTPPPNTPAPATTQPFQQSITNYSPGASYDTYSNYAPVGSSAWDKAYNLNPAGVMANLNNTQLNPYTSGQLAQANGINSGLAELLFKQDRGLGGQQFLQAAGFTNAPGSQTMMDLAGRNWMFANDPSYNGGHVRYGFTANGTPYSYSAVNGGPQIAKWAQTGQGPTPNGVTAYSQFALPQNYMANVNGAVAQPTPSTTMPGSNNSAAIGTTQANPYGAGYTGYGNINLASGNGATSTTATPSTIGAVNTSGTGTVDPNAGPSPAITQTPNTTTSAVPKARIANPAVGMPGAVGGLPNNANVNTNRTTMPVTPAPQVSGNYNMAIRQNHNMNNY